MRGSLDSCRPWNEIHVLSSNLGVQGGLDACFCAVTHRKLVSGFVSLNPTLLDSHQERAGVTLGVTVTLFSGSRPFSPCAR